MAEKYPEANRIKFYRNLEDLITTVTAADIEKDDKEDLNAWVQTLKQSRKGKVEILVSGKTGAGKSTLVGGLVGSKIKVMERLQPGTWKVSPNKLTKEGVKIIVWDSPGLQDGISREEEYLREIKEKCKNIDLILYCIDSSAPRSELRPTQRDFLAIKKFTDTFGHELWENAVFILTRGNTVVHNLQDIEVEDIDQAFEKKMEEWEGEIRHALKSPVIGLSEEIADNIPVVPAGRVNIRDLPGHKYWLSKLWTTAADHIKDSSKLDLIELNKHRLTELSKVTPDSFREDGPNQPIVVNHDEEEKDLSGRFKGVGMTGGAAAGAGMGALAGSAVPGVGTVAGAIGGAVLGAITGAVGGGLSGAGTHVLYKSWKKKCAMERAKKQD